jgi:hypothetical protein
MENKYKQELPMEVEAALDAYIDRIKAIQWFKPSPDIKREKVDVAIKAAISAFGVEASIEYRHLNTVNDWDAARDAAWGAAREAAWDAARDAARDAAWGAAREAAWGAAWDAARDAAREAAWGAAWNAAWGAADVLATFTKTYKKETPFVKLVDIWEMGLYPVGVVDGKFVVYVPPSKLEFPEDLK